MKVSERLLQAIADSGLTHYAIAKAAGVTPTQVSFFVSGQRSLTLESVDKLSAALGLELNPAKKAKVRASGHP